MAVTIRVDGDTTQLERSIADAIGDGSRKGSKEAEKSLRRLTAVSAGVGGALGGLAGGAAAVGLGAIKDFALGSVDAFAGLEDATGAASVIFGKSMDSIIAQSKTAAAELGLSSVQVIDAANTFGTFGKSAGLSGKGLAKFSTDFTELAGDLASFKGKRPEEAIEAIGSALRGESEPIRSFGVLLDDATLRAEALKLGLIDSVKEGLTPQQKVLAAQAAIFKQTKDAQGDFQRTSDSTANTQKRLAAETANARAELGAKFAPTVTFLRERFLEVIKGMGGFLTAAGDVSGFLSGTLGPVIGGIADAIKGTFDILFKGDFTGGFTKLFGEGAMFEDSPISLFLFGLRDNFKEFFAEVGPRIAKFADDFKKLAAVVLPIVKQIADKIISTFREMWPTIQSIWSTISEIIKSVLDLISLGIETFTKVVSFIWENFGQTILNFVTSAWKAVAQVIDGVLKVIKGILDVFIGIFTGDWDRAWKGIKSILSGAWEAIKGIIKGAFAAILGIFRVFGTSIRLILEKVWEGIKSLFSSGFASLVTTLVGFPALILGLVPKMLSAGAKFIGALFEGMKNALGAIGGFASDIASAVWNGIKNFINENLIDPIRNFHIRIDPPGPGVLFDGNPFGSFPRLATGGTLPPGAFGIVGDDPFNSRSGELIRARPNGGVDVFNNQDSRKLLDGVDTNVEINNNFYGPTISGDRRRETEWNLRYAV